METLIESATNGIEEKEKKIQLKKNIGKGKKKKEKYYTNSL